MSAGYADQSINPARSTRLAPDTKAAPRPTLAPTREVVAEVHVGRLIIGTDLAIEREPWEVEEEERRSAPLPPGSSTAIPELPPDNGRPAGSNFTGVRRAPLSVPPPSHIERGPWEVEEEEWRSAPLPTAIPELPPDNGRPAGSNFTGVRRVPLSVPPPSHSEHDTTKSCFCFTFLAVLFAVVITMAVLSMTTFFLMNSDVKNHCNSTLCSLNCDFQNVLCYLVYGGEGVVCVAAVFFIVSLLTRACYQVNL